MSARLSAVPDGPPQRKPVLTPADCRLILIKASSYDGRGVGDVEGESWYDAAVAQRWTSLELAIAAVIDYYSQPAKPGDRRWIMPGHITEYIRANARQPAPMSERWAEIEQARPAADEKRARAIAEMSAQIARKKRIPSGDDSAPVPATPEEMAAAKVAAREELRRARWARIDACGLCDDEGMTVASDGRLVCSHPE